MSNLRHCGIVVKDLDKMNKFYKLLGFEEVINTKENGEFIDNLIGKKNISINIVKLKSTSNNCIVELLQYKIKNSRSKIKLYEQGLSHIAITVNDIDKIISILKLNGAEFISAPLLSPDNKVKVCFCKDIEGNFLELVEEL